MWHILYSIMSSSDSTFNDLELTAVHLWQISLTRTQASFYGSKIIRRLFSSLFSRCPSPILQGDIQGGDGELHREREHTLERTRSAGKFSVF